LYEFKSRTKVTDFKALSNMSFLDAYIIIGHTDRFFILEV